MESTKVNIHIYNIEWDDDGFGEVLPNELDAVFDYGDDKDMLEDDIANWLSDTYGFCHYGFLYYIKGGEE